MGPVNENGSERVYVVLRLKKKVSKNKRTVSDRIRRHQVQDTTAEQDQKWTTGQAVDRLRRWVTRFIVDHTTWERKIVNFVIGFREDTRNRERMHFDHWPQNEHDHTRACDEQSECAEYARKGRQGTRLPSGASTRQTGRLLPQSPPPNQQQQQQWQEEQARKKEFIGAAEETTKPRICRE